MNTPKTTDNLLTLYMNDIKRYPLLSPEEETELAKKAVAGDTAAREGYGLMDLINEGNLGLLSAVEKYDPERGYHFISYAVWWIRQSILKAINEKARAIRLPLNRVNELLQIEKAMKNLSITDPNNGDWEKLAAETGLDEDLIRRLVEISLRPVSLEAPISGVRDEHSELGDAIADSVNETPENALENSSLKEEINRVLSTLPKKEAEILEMRFGLNGKIAMPLSDIAEVYNLTKERIRQIEQKALKTLRNTAGVGDLKAYRA